MLLQNKELISNIFGDSLTFVVATLSNLRRLIVWWSVHVQKHLLLFTQTLDLMQDPLLVMPESNYNTAHFMLDTYQDLFFYATTMFPICYLTSHVIVI